MPYSPAHPCAKSGCPNLTHKRFCPEHDREHWDNVHKQDKRPSPRARGYDDDWRAVRNSYLKLHPRCELCHEHHASIVHHVESVKTAPHRRLDMTNLQAVCKACHERAHGWDR